ncbi:MULTISPECIES: aldehyde dehydrogenase [unclassified Streptomyces]|uniref:aldehyde dehydrogenase n=1 Tax=Streptomyces sp. NRRL F-4428 TaxID=1609137 RepID=UPI000567D14A|nr:aldehyde dehydrogenase [Streptomyces sp. NRRL F-4428]KJK45347.1 betaine-aldehyde dehydrogenase [Streptomyces sp. NRRL F-4428]
MTAEAITHFIDGAAIASADGSTMPSIDPASRTVWAEVSCGGAQDVDHAVAAARAAFDRGPWPRMTQAGRSAVLHRLADLVLAHGDELALLDTMDMGRPLSLTRANDVVRSAANLRFFADDATAAADEAFPGHPAHHIYTRHEPAGVVAAVSPWNFPLMQATWKIAPALAHGNTVVLKPAEQSPASAVRLAELALLAGMPAGVLNVVHGTGPGGAGAALVAHRDVDLITFTGETRTGESIMRAAATGVRGVSFELGGKGASVIFADADIDRAVAVAADAAFSNAGQICLAGSRVLVQRPVYEQVVEALAKTAAGLRLGDPRDPATQVGPLSSAEHHAKVTGHLRRAAQDGATLLGGGAHDGWWVAPTVIVDADPGSAVCRDEVFGPVLTVHPFDTEEEAVHAANATPYGLSAMVFTDHLARAHRVAGQLRAGNVWVNCFWVRDLRSPFGGFGRSGIGREGGRHSRDFFTEAKTVVIDVS